MKKNMRLHLSLLILSAFILINSLAVLKAFAADARLDEAIGNVDKAKALVQVAEGPDKPDFKMHIKKVQKPYWISFELLFGWVD